MPRPLLQQQRFPVLAQCSTDRSMFQIPRPVQGLAPGKMGSSPTKATQPDCCSVTPPGVSYTQLLGDPGSEAMLAQLPIASQSCWLYS